MKKTYQVNGNYPWKIFFYVLWLLTGSFSTLDEHVLPHNIPFIMLSLLDLRHLLTFQNYLIRNTCVNRIFPEQTLGEKTLTLFQQRSLVSEMNKNKAEKVLEFLCMCVSAHNPCTSSLYCLITKARYKYINCLHNSLCQKLTLTFICLYIDNEDDQMLSYMI